MRTQTNIAALRSISFGSGMGLATSRAWPSAASSLKPHEQTQAFGYAELGNPDSCARV